MKVIEVLNKIKLFDDYRPNIKFKSKIYIYDNWLGNYYCGDYSGLFAGYCINKILDEEIEIIEDTPKRIEIPKHIPNEVIQDLDREICSANVKCIAHKVNELINYLQYSNELKKESDK